jgi:hypothetical protein
MVVDYLRSKCARQATHILKTEVYLKQIEGAVLPVLQIGPLGLKMSGTATGSMQSPTPSTMLTEFWHGIGLAGP